MAEGTIKKRTNRKETASPETQKVIIEVTRYKALLEALGDPRKVVRAILIISAVAVLLFAGITLVVLSVKRIYPYSDITTNALGATTIKNEKSEVSYWLLNTAELWANSGIKVKQGQTIKIRASGKKHTAIHHLVNNVDSNDVHLREPWVGTEGFSVQNNERDIARARFRIFPDSNQDALLVQIVPLHGKRKDSLQLRRPKTGYNQFEVIGKEKEIRIEEDGTLYFAINDIVLDDETVIMMMTEMEGMPADSITMVKMKEMKEDIKECRKTYKVDTRKAYTEFLNIFGFDSNANIPMNDGKFGVFKFGTNMDKPWIELFGYCMEEYREPWFEDNIGSFLIIVETVTE